MKTLISEAGKPDRTSRARAARLDKARTALAKIREDMDNQYGPEATEAAATQTITEAQMARGMAIGATVRRNRLRRENTLKRTASAESKLTEAIVSIVMDAVPLDEDSIAEFGDRIAGNTATFVGLLFENKVLSIDAFAKNPSETVRTLAAENVIGCNEAAADEAATAVADVVRKKTEKAIVAEVKSAEELNAAKQALAAKVPANPPGQSASSPDSTEEGLQFTPAKGEPEPGEEAAPSTEEGEAKETEGAAEETFTSTANEELESGLPGIPNTPAKGAPRERSTTEFGAELNASTELDEDQSDIPETKPVETVVPILLQTGGQDAHIRSTELAGSEGTPAAKEPKPHTTAEVVDSVKSAANTNETMGLQTHPGSGTQEGTISNEAAHLEGKGLGLTRTLRRKGPKTTFGKMFRKSMDKLVGESGEITHEITDRAAGNAAVQYAILETLNTMRLLNEDSTKVVIEMLIQ